MSFATSKLEDLKRSIWFKPQVELDEETVDQDLKGYLLASNNFLSAQVDKNKKYIKSLESILAWISSCSQSISPELTSLMLSCPSYEDEHDYELRLTNDFNKYICKSKYFTFIVELYPLTPKTVPKDKRFSLEVSIYSTDPTPKHITHNMQGKPITRGRGTEIMLYHPTENKFLVRIKMQITEVSSHFTNGCINLVIRKKNEMHYSVKPLVIKDIVIKAKEKTCKRWREQNSDYIRTLH